MAKHKTNVAPGATLASLPADAMDAWRANVDLNKVAIKKACDSALATENRGYAEQLAASTAIGISWDQLAIWKPADVRVQDNANENHIRTVHMIVEPSSSSLALQQLKDILAPLSTACTDASVDHVRKTLGRDSFPVREKGKTCEEGKAKLDAMLADATKAGDKGKVAQINAAISAINRTDEMVVLVNELNALETANGRFRKRMFLHLIAPQMAVIPERERGKHYLSLCSIAFAQQKKFAALPGQDRTVKRLQEMVTGAVGDDIGKRFGTKEKEVKSNLVLAGEATRAIFNSTRRAFALKAIPETTHNAILLWLTSDPSKGGAGLEDPEDIRQDELQAKKTARIVAKNAELAAQGKSPKGAKGKGKAAGPASSKARKARSTTPPRPRAPRATPAAATTGTPAPVVSTTTNDAEDVLADMNG